MAMVMLTCPKTGKPLPTGIELDERSFDTMAFEARGKGRASVVPCPHCGKAHSWGGGGAYLAATGPLRQASPGE